VGKVKKRQGQSVDLSRVKKNRNKYLESVRLMLKFESGSAGNTQGEVKA